MKKAIVSAILGLVAVVCVRGQGQIILYNYPGPYLITYGVGAGGPLGNPVIGGFSVSYYWGVGDQTAALNASMVAGGSVPLTPASGANIVATIGTDVPGYFSNVT